VTDTVGMGDLVLFDLDNTLIDRALAFASWARQFMAHHQLPADAWATIDLLDHDGFRPREIFFGEIRLRFGLASDVERLVTDFSADLPRHCTVDGETLNSVRRLRSVGWKVGVVTNGSPSQGAKLDATGLTAEVDAICISSAVGFKKPEIGIFEEAARLCGIPLQGWMVGDSPDADIVGGRRAGLRTIWMSRGRVWDRRDFRPDAVARSVPEAVEIILGERG
jgi:FMN phosphatase YigB (HAD superfamily)